jgi:hypothetical protein
MVLKYLVVLTNFLSSDTYFATITIEFLASAATFWLVFVVCMLVFS